MNGKVLSIATHHVNSVRSGLLLDLALHPCLPLAVTAGQDNTVRVWDLASGQQQRMFKGEVGLHLENPLPRCCCTV